MDYKVLSRKYRPQNFNEIIGQPHVVNTLINSINLNRLAHGYLFSGVRGVGKTTAARVLSKTLNCLDKKDSTTCNKCQNCIEITESRSLDVIELDGASNRGIDEIREIRETVKYPPISGIYKVFIIDEVHMLTKEAFNALLKTLEEPPDNVIFILATTDSHKIPDTILSRVLRFDFKKITNSQISDHMANILEKENVDYEETALNAVAVKADGSVRDSLSILDRIISYSDKTITYDLVKESLGIIEDQIYLKLLGYIIKGNQEKLLFTLKEIVDSGYSIDNFISGFNTFLSHILICLSGYDTGINSIVLEWVKENQNNINTVDVMRIIEEVNKYELKSKHLLQPDIALESLFIKLSVMDSSIKISELLEKLPSQSDSSNNISISENISKDNKNKILTKVPEAKKEEQNNTDSIIETLSIETEDLVKKWGQIIEIIDIKDKRISNSLDDAKISIENQNVIINIEKTGNSYIFKTLNDNKDLIQDCISQVMDHKIDIEIKGDFDTEIDNKVEEHPLLDDIKKKFN